MPMSQVMKLELREPDNLPRVPHLRGRWEPRDPSLDHFTHTVFITFTCCVIGLNKYIISCLFYVGWMGSSLESCLKIAVNTCLSWILVSESLIYKLGSVTCGLTFWFCDGDHIEIVLGRKGRNKLRWLRSPHGLLGPSTAFVVISQDNTVSFLSGYLGSTVTLNPLEVTFNLLEVQLSEGNGSGLSFHDTFKMQSTLSCPSDFGLILRSQKRLIIGILSHCVFIIFLFSYSA